MANGESDILLLPGQVKVSAWDLCLDSEDRRDPSASPGGHRRAMVHDHKDGLTLNWDNDYRRGVRIIDQRVAITVPQRWHLKDAQAPIRGGGAASVLGGHLGATPSPESLTMDPSVILTPLNLEPTEKREVELAHFLTILAMRVAAMEAH
jgi:hypothetical protein